MSLMHSCRRVAELRSERLDEPLGLLDELRLKMHLSMCDNCSHVADQIEAVHRASAELLSKGFEHEEAERPADAR